MTVSVRETEDGFVIEDGRARLRVTGLTDDEQPLRIIGECPRCGVEVSRREYDPATEPPPPDALIDSHAMLDAVHAKGHSCGERS